MLHLNNQSFIIRGMKRIIHVLGLAALVAVSSANADNSKIKVIDAIVASIDGKPITLSDLGKKLNPHRSLTLSEAASDAQAKTALEDIIVEKLILAEGESRKMEVTDSDIESYLKEVAARNKMSREQFEEALSKQGITLLKYKDDIKLDILKSRLASTFLRSSVSVTDEEAEKYLQEKIGSSEGSSQIQLRQIFVVKTNRSTEEAQKKISAAREELAKGLDFAEVAKKYSESSDKAEGGLLGIISQKDLGPELFDAVFPLKEGEVSKTVETADGFRIMKVEKLFSGEKQHDPRLIAEARSHLEKRKMEEKLNSFFLTDIYKLHSVEKKI